jgi:hypothetical protein
VTRQSLPFAHVFLAVFHILQFIVSPANLASKTDHCQLSEDAELEATNEESPINKHVWHFFFSCVLVANLHFRINSSTSISFLFLFLSCVQSSDLCKKRNSSSKKKLNQRMGKIVQTPPLHPIYLHISRRGGHRSQR